MDKRELRLAIKAKLDHRHKLMQQNSRLEGRNDFLVKTLANPLVDMVLEDCADHIMKAVMDHAIKASEVVADETLDGQDYEVGINIPSLHIRHRIHRVEFDTAREMSVIRSVRQLRYDGTRNI